MGISHSSVLGKIDSAGKVILAVISPFMTGEKLLIFILWHKEVVLTQVQSVSLVGLD